MSAKKRWLVITIICVLLLSGCGKADITPAVKPNAEPTPPSPSETVQPESNVSSLTEEEELVSIRKQIADSGALIGLAYLGAAEMPSFADVLVYLEANGFHDLYPFLTRIPESHFVKQEGTQLFAIVPASPEVKLTIRELRMDDTLIHSEPGEILLEIQDNQPILLMGLSTEMLTNLYIQAEDPSGLCVDYTPYLNIEDGLPCFGEGVYDFSPTELLGQFLPGDPPASMLDFCDTWYAQHCNGDGELMVMELTLNADGTTVYSYGYPNSEIVERFDGTWSTTDTDQLELTLSGGSVHWDDSAAAGESYQIESLFDWKLHNSTLLLEHVEGAPLLFATEAATYSFLPFDGYYLMGDWHAKSDYWGWTYELQLFNNGECWFNMYDTENECLVVYEGWWSVEDNVLALSMMLTYGQHPETPEKDYIWGNYKVTVSGENEMALEYECGEILTVNMESSRVETFGGTSDIHSTCISVYDAHDLNVDWSMCDWIILDEWYPMEVAFCTMVPVEDFTLHSLSLQSISDDGTDMDFATSELFAYGTLTPEKPLRVILTIDGTIPTYGVSYTDPNGRSRLFGILISGYDGSLELMEIP